MKHKALSVLSLTLALLLLFCSCGGDNNSNNSITTVKPPEEIKAEPPVFYKSALTGLPVEDEEAQNRRPVAIMINNIKIATPQEGISYAEVMYECIVEGAQTRLMMLVMEYEEQSQYVCMLCGGDKRSTEPCCTSCMAIYY